jgi:Tfp pilus assembly protein PilE
MLSRRGITLVESVVIICIVCILVAIAVPKFMEAVIKNKMWDAMTSLMTYESAQMAYFAQCSKIGQLDSLRFRQDSSAYFLFAEEGAGRYKATARMKIGRFEKAHSLFTRIDTANGMPLIRRSCLTGDSSIVKRYIPFFFK